MNQILNVNEKHTSDAEFSSDVDTNIESKEEEKQRLEESMM